MAAINSTWDETVPAGSEVPKNGDDRIRELKLNIRERARNGGHRMQTAGATTDAKDGRHCCGESAAAGSGEATGTFNIYAADGSTIIWTAGDSTATPASTITTSLNVVTGTQKTLAIGLGGGSTGVVAGVYFENRSPNTMTLLGAKLVCATAPSGSALDVDVLRLTTGYTDPGSGGTTIFSARPTVGVGNKVGTESTSLSITSLLTTEALYFNIVALNAADNIVVYIRYKS